MRMLHPRSRYFLSSMIPLGGLGQTHTSIMLGFRTRLARLNVCGLSRVSWALHHLLVNPRVRKHTLTHIYVYESSLNSVREMVTDFHT